jgi:hypothetical protein
MNTFNDKDVISTYALEQAIADGVLVEIFKDRWKTLSGGKPIVATARLYNAVSLAGLLEIWNEFVWWKKAIKYTLPPVGQRLYETIMNSERIWVAEDGAAVTLMYPDDY